LKKVISFSLYGDNPRYCIGAVKNAILAQRYMPNWECRFYIGPGVPMPIVQMISMFENCSVADVTGFPYPQTFSRFLALADKDVDVAICRDVDARVSARDMHAISEWLNSGLNFHIMKDHPVGHPYLISAGMFGARSGKLDNILDMIKDFIGRNPTEYYTIDQDFLAQMVFPIIKDDCMYHSEHYDCNPTGNSIQKAFPTENRYPFNYIGAALSESDVYLYSVDSEPSLRQGGGGAYHYDFDLLEGV